MVWPPKVSAEVLIVADTGTLAVPKVPVIAVPAPLEPTASMKYSAAVIVLPEELTVAERLTVAAPLVGLGVAVIALTAGGATTFMVMSWYAVSCGAGETMVAA